MAAVFNVTIDQFDKLYRRHASPDAVKSEGGKTRIWFHCRKIIDAWARTVGTKAGPAAEPTADPLLDGDVTPGLERYREARADLAEMERDRQRGDLISRQALEPVLLQLSGTLRRAGDNLARQYGNDAAAVLNEAVTEWEAGCEVVLNVESGTTAQPQAGGVDQDAPAADDAPVR